MVSKFLDLNNLLDGNGRFHCQTIEENYGYLFVPECNNAQESHTGQCLRYFVVFVFVMTVCPLLKPKHGIRSSGGGGGGFEH